MSDDVSVVPVVLQVINISDQKHKKVLSGTELSMVLNFLSLHLSWMVVF